MISYLTSAKQSLFISFTLWLLVFTSALFAAPASGTAPAGEKQGAEVRQQMTFRQAWQTLVDQSPDLQLEQANVISARSEQIKANLQFPENPQLDLNYQTGKKRLSRILSTDPISLAAGTEQDGQGYEVGLSQKLEIAGQRGLRQKIAQLNVKTAEHKYRSRVFALRGRLRENYYAHSAMREMSMHLQEHINHLAALRRRMGPGFRDPRLGRYVSTALNADLVRLRAEKNDIDLQYIQRDIALKRLLGLSAQQEITTDPLSKFEFPEPPPLEELLHNAEETHPGLVAARLSMESSQSEMDLEERKFYPDPTIYFYGGTHTYGDSGLSPQVVGPQAEKESYFRVGMSIPIPVVDTNTYGKQKARARGIQRQAHYNKLVNTYTTEISSAHRSYRGQIKLLDELRSSLRRLAANRQSLANALVRRRISYFEFWSEHERWHDLLIAYHERYLSALNSLARIETMTARAFGDVPIKIPSVDENPEQSGGKPARSGQ